MPVIRAPKGQWCDYCRTRFSRELLSQKPASWTVVSESRDRQGSERHYCQSCAEIVSEWSGGIWELQDQINYASKGDRLDV